MLQALSFTVSSFHVTAFAWERGLRCPRILRSWGGGGVYFFASYDMHWSVW